MMLKLSGTMALKIIQKLIETRRIDPITLMT